MRSLTRILALVLAATLFFAACSSDDDDSASDDTETTTTVAETDSGDDAEAEESNTIVDVAVANGSFTTLVAAVQEAGLVETLSGEGPFTVFAPTDEAFEAALADLGITAEELLADPTLGDILTYHVVAGEFLAADVVGLDGTDVETVNGATVAVSVDGENVMVNDANVVTTDVMADNGVIHVIDKVLLPPS